MWYLLRRNRQQVHFRRQHGVGTYILDFYCAEAKLCVEVDGPVHGEQVDHDQRRADWLTGEGIRVIRFSAEDVAVRAAWVVAQIVRAAAPSTA